MYIYRLGPALVPKAKAYILASKANAMIEEKRLKVDGCFQQCYREIALYSLKLLCHSRCLFTHLKGKSHQILDFILGSRKLN